MLTFILFLLFVKNVTNFRYRFCQLGVKITKLVSKTLNMESFRIHINTIFVRLLLVPN